MFMSTILFGMLWCSWAHDIVQAHFSLLYFPVMGEKQTTSVLCFGGSYAYVFDCDEHLLRLLLFLLLHHQLLLSLSLSLYSFFIFNFPSFFLFPCAFHQDLILRLVLCAVSLVGPQIPDNPEWKLEQEYEGEFFSRVTFLMIHFFRSLAEGEFHIIIYSCPHLKQKSLFTFLKKKKNKSSRFWRMLSSLYEYVTFNIRVCVDFPCNFP